MAVNTENPLVEVLDAAALRAACVTRAVAIVVGFLFVGCDLGGNGGLARQKDITRVGISFASLLLLK